MQLIHQNSFFLMMLKQILNLISFILLVVVLIIYFQINISILLKYLNHTPYLNKYIHYEIFLILPFYISNLLLKQFNHMKILLERD